MSLDANYKGIKKKNYKEKKVAQDFCTVPCVLQNKTRATCTEFAFYVPFYACLFFQKDDVYFYSYNRVCWWNQ